MTINCENHEGYFYAKNPQIDPQGRMTFANKNCTHFIIVSGSGEDGIDIREEGILDCIAKLDLRQTRGEALAVGKYRVRCIKQASYVAAGNCVQMDAQASSHAVYGCVYSPSEDKLDIYIPPVQEDSVVFIPLTVKYQIRRQMTEARRGFLGIGRRDAEFTGIYILRIDDVQDYQNGCISYVVNGYEYCISKEMLGRNIYVKADKSKAEPILRTTNRSINLVKV